MRSLITTSIALLSILLSSCQGPGEAFEEAAYDRAGSAQQLARFIQMEGEWRIVGGDHAQGATHLYRTIANGTVVLETAFPGETHEMVTVFHLDGPSLVMTHYCAAGNQPYMVAEHPSGDKVHFRFVGASDLNDPKAPHMRDASYHFIDSDRVDSNWSYWEGGEQQSVMKIELERVPE